MQQDLSKCEQLWERAAEQGDDMARENLATLREHMKLAAKKCFHGRGLWIPKVKLNLGIFMNCWERSKSNVFHKRTRLRLESTAGIGTFVLLFGTPTSMHLILQDLQVA